MSDKTDWEALMDGAFGRRAARPAADDTRRRAEQARRELEALMKEGCPIFNLRSAFPYLIDNSFPTPCRQCVVMERGRLSVCGRCVEVPGLCRECGYFFAAEYALVFQGKLPVIADMLSTYLKYI